MCLLKNIEVNCEDFLITKIENPLYEKCSNKFAKHLLCSSHQILYKNWLESGGYFKLLVNNMDASEEENVEFFKKELVG